MVKSAEDHGIDIDDLQAAIDASTHVSTPKKSEPEESEVKSMPEPAIPKRTAKPKEPVKEKTEPISDEKDSEEAIKVQVNKSESSFSAKQREDTEESKPQPEAQEGTQIAIVVKKTAPIEKTVQSESVPVTRQGKTIQPMGSRIEPPSKQPEVAQDTTTPPETAPAQGARVMAHKKVLAPIENTAKNDDPVAPPQTDEEDTSGIKIEGLETKNTEEVAEEAKNIDQNSVKIFDAKEYHLPIKANRHHRKTNAFKVLIIVGAVLIAIAAGAYAMLGTDLFG